MLEGAPGSLLVGAAGGPGDTANGGLRTSGIVTRPGLYTVTGRASGHRMCNYPSPNAPNRPTPS